MLSFFRNRQLKKWQEISADEYAEVYAELGGSVLSNPLVVDALSLTTGLPINYYALFDGGQIVAAIPVWKKWVAGSKKALKKSNKKGMVDMGNAELILPIRQQARIILPVEADGLSALQAENITNLKPTASDICLAKPHSDFSKKFRYNRKREERLLEEKGMELKSVMTYTNEQITQIYTTLFEKRWGFKPTGHEHLQSLLDLLRPLLFGSIIELEGEPIAFQLIYKVECSQHISMEYINGGVNTDFNALSPGSVLTFINTQHAWAISEQQNKPLRYSFGKADNAYKDRWCQRSAVYSV
jgi:hypothetical protein